jgi:hypothetical protein
MPDLVVPRDLQGSLRKDETEHDATGLVFTAFIDSHTTGGHGLGRDRHTKALGRDVSTGERYRDLEPGDVLRVALYSDAYVQEVIARSGWSLTSDKDPTPLAHPLEHR